MTIELNKAAQTRLTGSIKKYFQDNMEEEIGDLKATLLLDFILKEIGPAIYNSAVSDAQAVMMERVTELDSVCFATDSE